MTALARLADALDEAHAAADEVVYLGETFIAMPGFLRSVADLKSAVHGRFQPPGAA